MEPLNSGRKKWILTPFEGEKGTRKQWIHFIHLLLPSAPSPCPTWGTCLMAGLVAPAAGAGLPACGDYLKQNGNFVGSWKEAAGLGLCFHCPSGPLRLTFRNPQCRPW